MQQQTNAVNTKKTPNGDVRIKCRYGDDCKYKTKCKFQHTPNERIHLRKNLGPIYDLDENMRTLISVINKFRAIASSTGGEIDPRAVQADKEGDAILAAVGTIAIHCERVIKSLGTPNHKIVTSSTYVEPHHDVASINGDNYDNNYNTKYGNTQRNETELGLDQRLDLDKEFDQESEHESGHDDDYQDEGAI